MTVFDMGKNIKQQLPLEHEHCGNWADRADAIQKDHPFSNAETIYLEVWQEENEKHDILGHLLGGPEHANVKPNAEQCRIAADVVQWLGTNIGQAFIQRCEGRFNGARALRDKLRYSEPQAYDAPFLRATFQAMLAERIEDLMLFVESNGPTCQEVLDHLLEAVQKMPDPKQPEHKRDLHAARQTIKMLAWLGRQLTKLAADLHVKWETASAVNELCRSAERTQHNVF